MSDYSELKRLVFATDDCEDEQAWKDFTSAANPASVLELIVEVERLERKNDNQAQTIREYSDLVMGGDVSLGMLRADLRVTTGERDQLKAEVEVLRKDAERYRWLMKTGLYTVIYANSASIAPGRGPYICIDLPSSGAPNRVALGSGADGYIDAAMSKESHQ